MQFGLPDLLPYSITKLIKHAGVFLFFWFCVFVCFLDGCFCGTQTSASCEARAPRAGALRARSGRASHDAEAWAAFRGKETKRHRHVLLGVGLVLGSFRLRFFNHPK